MYNTEDLNTVMPMYNLLEYSDNYSIASGNFRNYYSDEINDDENEIDDNSNKINNNKATTSKFFKYMIKLIGSAPKNNSRLNTEVVVR